MLNIITFVFLFAEKQHIYGLLDLLVCFRFASPKRAGGNIKFLLNSMVVQYNLKYLNYIGFHKLLIYTTDKLTECPLSFN